MGGEAVSTQACGGSGRTTSVALAQLVVVAEARAVADGRHERHQPDLAIAMLSTANEDAVFQELMNIPRD